MFDKETIQKLWEFMGSLREEYGGTKEAPAVYTWAGKGYGGANIVDGIPHGLDCSGFVLGLLRRLLLYPHGGQINSQAMHDQAVPVASDETNIFDLIFFGTSPSGVYHVAMVLIPGVLYIDCGGGGSKTKPGGADWPPARGRVFRFNKWSFRSSELVSYGRLRKAVSEEDHAIVAEWKQHVAACRRGECLQLSERLVKNKYRPMWQGYDGLGL